MCAVLLLGTCMYALGLQRISQAQPKIRSNTFYNKWRILYLAAISYLVVNSLDYLKVITILL